MMILRLALWPTHIITLVGLLGGGPSHYQLSNNVGSVKHFWDALARALRRARHFALVEAFAFALPTKARS